MVKLAASILPSQIFLLFESIGLAYHSYNPKECALLTNSNFSVSLFFSAYFAYQALFAFTNSGGVWSMSRITSFRDISLTKALQCVCFVISATITFLQFGMRQSKKVRTRLSRGGKQKKGLSNKCVCSSLLAFTIYSTPVGGGWGMGDALRGAVVARSHASSQQGICHQHLLLGGDFF